MKLLLIIAMLAITGVCLTGRHPVTALAPGAATLTMVAGAFATRRERP